MQDLPRHERRIIQAVQHDPWAHHVEVGVVAVQRARTVRRVSEWYPDAGSLNRLGDPAKLPDLLMREAQVFFIGGREVGEDAFEFDPGQFG